MLSFLITIMVVAVLWVAISSSDKKDNRKHAIKKRKKKETSLWDVDMRETYKKYGLPM